MEFFILARMERPKPMRRCRFGRRALLTAAAGVVLAAGNRAALGDTATIRIGYIRWAEPEQTISLLDKPPRDDGLAGAKLAINDNNTTGQFIGQQFELTDALVHDGDDPTVPLAAMIEHGITLVMTDVPAALLLKLADSGRDKGVTLFNMQAPDDSLRQEDCRDNVIHVAPSRAMLADALAQYLVWKKWTRWVLVYGSHPDDAAAGGCLSSLRQAVWRTYRQGNRIQGHRRRRARRIPVSCRPSSRCPSSPRDRPTTTCW